MPGSAMTRWGGEFDPEHVRYNHGQPDAKSRQGVLASLLLHSINARLSAFEFISTAVGLVARHFEVYTRVERAGELLHLDAADVHGEERHLPLELRDTVDWVTERCSDFTLDQMREALVRLTRPVATSRRA